MSRRLDFISARNRDRIAKNGADNVRDFSLPAGLSPPKARKSKADRRAEAAAAVASITRIVRCQGCGHQATIAVLPSMAGRKFRCSQCGEVAE